MAHPLKPWPKVKNEVDELHYKGIKIIQFDRINAMYKLTDGTLIDAKSVHEEMMNSSYLIFTSNYKNNVSYKASEPKMFKETLETPKETFKIKSPKITSDQIKILRGSAKDISIFNNSLFVSDADIEILEGFQGKDVYLMSSTSDSNDREFSSTKIINRSSAEIIVRPFIHKKNHRFVEIESYSGSIDIADYKDVNIWAFNKTKEIIVSDSKNITIKVYGAKAFLDIKNNNEDCCIWTYNNFDGVIKHEEMKVKKLSFFEKLKLKLENMFK